MVQDAEDHREEDRLVKERAAKISLEGYTMTNVLLYVGEGGVAGEIDEARTFGGCDRIRPPRVRFCFILGNAYCRTEFSLISEPLRLTKRCFTAYHCCLVIPPPPPLYGVQASFLSLTLSFALKAKLPRPSPTAACRPCTKITSFQEHELAAYEARKRSEDAPDAEGGKLQNRRGEVEEIPDAAMPLLEQGNPDPDATGGGGGGGHDFGGDEL